MSEVGWAHEKAQLIVDDMLEDLRDRRGFEWWWDDIDAEIQQEIAAELVARVAHRLQEDL